MSISEAKRRTVLIVDDHHLVGEAFSLFLSGTGDYVPTLARNVLEAKAEILASGPFDLVLLDLYMPGMEGPDSISEIVRLNRNGHVVVFTGGNSPFRQSAIFSAGASGLILKSQPAKQILEALEDVFEGELYFPLADDRNLDRVMAQTG